LQSLGFLAPEQKEEGIECTAAIDTYAFGVLTYYMLFMRLPEGCFDLPCKTLPEARRNWDVLLSRCLQVKPSMRPLSLLKELQDALAAPKPQGDLLSLSEIEPKIDNVLQMAFEL